MTVFGIIMSIMIAVIFVFNYMLNRDIKSDNNDA